MISVKVLKTPTHVADIWNDVNVSDRRCSTLGKFLFVSNQ